MPKVILVEDNQDLRESLVDCLSLFGNEVTGIGSGMEFYQAIAKETYDIAILDVGLPDADGFSLASFVQENRDMGIVMLTARGQTDDRIKGFGVGADLYFVKPVDCRELGAAVENLWKRLSRAGGTKAPSPQPGTPAPQAPETEGIWSFDTTDWILRAPSGTDVSLTPKEFTLLSLLIKNAGEPVSRWDLMEELGYGTEAAGNRSLDAIVQRLRQKIRESTEDRNPIKTVHGVGYMFAGPMG